MKVITNYLLAFYIFPIFFFGQNLYAQKQSIADSLWAHRPEGAAFPESKIKDSLNGKLILDSVDKKQLQLLNIKWFMIGEKYRLDIRTWGIDFWKQCPNDKRRFQWLLETMREAPTYYKDLEGGIERRLTKKYDSPINIDEYFKWKQQYQFYRKEFLASHQVTEKEKKQLIYLELIRDVGEQLYTDIRKINKFDYYSWAQKAIKYARYWYANEYDKCIDCFGNGLDYLQAQFVDFIVLSSNDLGINEPDQERLLKMFASANIFRLSEHAQSRLLLLALNKTPFKLNTQTVDGTSIDMKDLLGKVVLIDFWNTHCTGCIHLMPFTKQVYEKYKSKGFEVISVCADSDADKVSAKKRAIEIDKKIGANWPLVFLDPFEPIYKKYGFVGAPHLLLFDKSGKLVMYNNDLLKKDGLEPIVHKLLTGNNL
jgi:thiol-disulfide isomerase/thioredoxin